MGEQVRPGDVECNWRHKNVIGGDGCNRNEGGKDSTVSTLHHDLKQVEMDVLAVYQAGQHKQHQYTMVNIPRPSQLPIHHYRHPIELADPPCC